MRIDSNKVFWKWVASIAITALLAASGYLYGSIMTAIDKKADRSQYESDIQWIRNSLENIERHIHESCPTK